MCNDCGCDEKTTKKDTKQTTEDNTTTIEVNQSVTVDNDTLAKEIAHNLIHHEILAVNIMGSPGAGKTTFIERIAKYIPAENLLVIQGDLESDVDKKRLEKKNIQTFQINTHSGCHLTAEMIEKAIKSSMLEEVKFVLIENVGNLVCPAGMQIGQHLDLVVSSTTEGSDKPKKYPHIFMNSKATIISKYDLASAVDFNENEYMQDLKGINPKMEIFKTTKHDLETWRNVSKYLIMQRERLIKSHSHQ